MSSIRRLMLRSLPILLLLMSTPLIAQSSTVTPLPTNPLPSTIWTDGCVETCEADCKAELDKERQELVTKCQDEQTKAVASERRYYEPIMARLTAENHTLQHDVAFWRDLAIGLGILALVGIPACAALC